MKRSNDYHITEPVTTRLRHLSVLRRRRRFRVNDIAELKARHATLEKRLQFEHGRRLELDLSPPPEKRGAQILEETQELQRRLWLLGSILAERREIELALRHIAKAPW